MLDIFLKGMGNIKRNKIAFQFMLTYTLIILIVSVFSLAAYFQASRSLEESALKYNQALIEQVSNILDARMAEIDSVVTKISFDSRITELLDSSHMSQGQIAVSMLGILKDISIYKVSNQFINSLYIYYVDLDKYIAPESSYKGREFYELYNGEFAENEYAVWKNNYLVNYNFKKFYLAHNKENLLYIHSIPLNNFFKPTGAILIDINVNEIHELFEKAHVNSGGFAYILDSNGDLITTVQNDIGKEEIYTFLNKDETQKKLFQNNKYLISKVTSTYNGWTYGIVIPTSQVMHGANAVKKTLLGMIVTSILFGLIVACYISYKNAKPIQNAISLLKDYAAEATGNNEFRKLDYIVSNLIKKDKNLQSKLNEQTPLIRAAFLERLLSGRFSEKENTDAMLKQVDIHVNGKMFTVLIVQIMNYKGVPVSDYLKEINTSKFFLVNDFKLFFDIFYDIDIDIDKQAFIIPFEEGSVTVNKTEIENKVSLYKSRLKTEYDLMINMACGNLCENINDIFFSYKQALQALEYGFDVDSSAVIWFENIHLKSDQYYYPLNVEMRLINLVKEGEETEALKVLKYVHEENFEKRQLSADMLRYLLGEIKGTVQKAVESTGATNSQFKDNIYYLLKSTDNYKDPVELFKSFEEIFLLMCNFVVRQENEEKGELVQKILEFINKNVCSNSFSQTLVAANFKLSEPYLSTFFKEQMQEGFFEYVEALRLKKACELLKSTNDIIEEISNSVGYANANSFRRAFKRKYGVTPNAYRDASKEKV